MVSEKKNVLSFSHKKSVGTNDARGVASLDPRVLVGRIYVVDRCILNLLAPGLMVSEKIFEGLAI